MANDKALHFGISFVGTLFLREVLHIDNAEVYMLGAGVGKELTDDTFDWGDLGADIAGVGLASVIKF